MALHIGSGFSQMARIETQIHAVLATIVDLPQLGHQPFISKKKEARRKRDEQDRALELLRSTTLDQIEFGPTQVSAAYNELADLEQQMRLSLGIDNTTPAAVAKLARPAKVETKASPSTLFAKPRTEMHIVKRRIEVLLQVARQDGSELPFFHEETQGSEFEAELSAGRKARGYGFKVLSTIQVTIQEQACDRWA